MGYGKKKKLIEYENSFSDKLHQQVITAAVHSEGIPIQCPLVTNRSRHSMLLSVVGNIWLLVCRDKWRFDRSYVPNGFIFDQLYRLILRSSVL